MNNSSYSIDRTETNGIITRGAHWTILSRHWTFCALEDDVRFIDKINRKKAISICKCFFFFQILEYIFFYIDFWLIVDYNGSKKYCSMVRWKIWKFNGTDYLRILILNYRFIMMEVQQVIFSYWEMFNLFVVLWRIGWDFEENWTVEKTIRNEV